MTMVIRMRWPLVVVVLSILSILVRERPARADSSTSDTVAVAVLAFDSDDAEEQADALTGSVRSRVRASQGWSLIETTQSLGMLSAALRCPAKPLSAECAAKVGEQLKVERYIYGYVAKGPAGQVTAELHLYQRGKPDTVAKESYTDNLKDQNDDTLRKIAQRLLDRLGGNAVGVAIIHFGTEGGEAVIDGEKHIPLDRGAARLELSPGSHSVEVSAPGQPAQKRTILVTAGKETSVDLTPTKAATEPPPRPEKPFPTRKVIGVAAMVVGVGAGVFAVERLLKYNQLQNDLKNDPNYGPDKFQKTNGEVDACDALLVDGTPSANACQKSKDAKTVSTQGIVAAAAGGVFLLGGAYLFFFAPSDDKEGKSQTASRKPLILPSVGPGSGSLSVSGVF
jgi:hypothetical protein